MTTFFTADLHLGHEAIRTYEPTSRPFRTVDEMNEAIVDAWNDTVGPSDTVWVLGDVSLRPQVAFDLVPLLNGRKVLVAGNHDRCWTPEGRDPQSKHARAAAKLLPAYLDVFHEVHPAGIVDGRTVDGIPVVLSHLPAVGDSRSGGDRHPNARPTARRLPIVCGHVHGRWRTTQRPVQVNVGIDVWGLRPVREDVLGVVLRSLAGGPPMADPAMEVRRRNVDDAFASNTLEGLEPDARDWRNAADYVHGRATLAELVEGAKRDYTAP